MLQWWAGAKGWLTSIPVLKKAGVQSLSLEARVDGEEIVHGQVPLVSLEEQRIEPREEGLAKHALAVLDRDRLGRARALPFLLRLEPQQGEAEGKGDGENDGSEVVVVEKPGRSDPGHVQHDGGKEEELGDDGRLNGSAMLKVGENQQRQGGNQGQDGGGQRGLDEDATARSQQCH